MISKFLYRNESGYTQRLQDISYPYYLQKKLEHYYITLTKNNPDFVKKDKDSIKKRIHTYFEHDTTPDSIINWNENKPSNIDKIARPITLKSTSKSDMSQIAKKSASFFRQADEFYFTSLNMDKNTSPLVEYYSFLQCVKGCVLLKLKINESLMFKTHGLTCWFDPERHTYPQASIKTFGVFHTILLIEDSLNEMKDYYSGKRNLALDQLLEERTFSPATAFIISFLLSNLVRYYPIEWQKILLAEDNDIIRKINKFREDTLPDAIERLFPYLLRV